jgi:hypothetical protein
MDAGTLACIPQQKGNRPMAYYTGQTYTKEHNGQTYRIRIEPDIYADSSELGTYTDKPDDVTFCVWRSDGTLRGAMPPEPTTDDYPENEDGFWDAYAQREENGPEILTDGFPRMWANEYKYFVPFCGGMRPTDPGFDKAEWAKYAEQGYRRAEDLNRGGWGYVGVVVETDAPACGCRGHVETLDASLWNCESDYPDSDFDEVIDTLIADLEADLAKLDLAQEAGIVL